MTKIFQNHKYLILALFFASLNIGTIFLIFGFQRYGDTPEYLQTIRLLGGEDSGVILRRIITPLGPFLALPFEFLGEGAGLVVQNIIFYLLSAFLIFRITELIYHQKKQALLASLLFSSSVPLLTTGLAYLIDMGGWFFYLLSIFLTLLYLKNKEGKFITLNGLLSGLGTLMKESGVLGMPFFGLAILLSGDLKFKEKISKLLHFAVFFLIPFLAFQAFMFKYFHFTFLNVYLNGRVGQAAGEEGLILSSMRYLGQFFIVLGTLWPFVLIGALREVREKNQARLKIFLALLPSSLSFLFWSTGAGMRTVAFFLPLGILLATYGLDSFSQIFGKRQKILVISLILFLTLVLNYYFVWINPHIQFVDRLVEFLLGLLTNR